ncbi:uncharacterized protein K444DRAFT_613672 [Hyaloscypha bicolor E]|uniref:Uncharacterized protein n=1 Tax=Hyaloscypha bicolor E TaxID=1095630 RepID=A0A2J6T772_9HELO|nr:uncharacterized protein K444DRAFT_613672 [Hyaloscypha bicolor E]PMD58872.1 hypothetical protein K444DRAFT_613672 [Hyaloscypha bicolor E]
MAISPWYSSGFSISCSSNALSIGGVIVLRRPTPFEGALVVIESSSTNGTCYGLTTPM